MAHRHHVQSGGGKKKYPTSGHEPRPALSYGNKDVVKEAFEKKDGGAVKRKSGGKVPGRASGGRLDKRARGGGVGADHHPFSSAFKSSDEHLKRGGHAKHHSKK